MSKIKKSTTPQVFNKLLEKFPNITDHEITSASKELKKNKSTREHIVEVIKAGGKN